jgi:tRNA pseudouridine32 synthase/23S rRNA pseudouridine746 synthase
LSGLGFGIVNDRYYPDLLPEQSPDFEKPLQLLARRLSFTDPVTGNTLDFRCTMKLIKLAEQV